MNRPALTLQTVYFHDSDREEARRLGGDLYARLTRPANDPLAHGPGIPVLVGVAADLVDLQAADTVMLIPVLGAMARGLMRDRVIETLKKWHGELGPGHVLTVPVFRKLAGGRKQAAGGSRCFRCYTEKGIPVG